MIHKEQIERIQQRVETYERPILSLYASVNPARPENNPRALLVRVKNTLKELAVPAEVGARVLDYFANAPPRAKSVALFANRAGMDRVEMSVELQVEDGRGQLEARWGEPYLTPLLVALDDMQHFAVVYVDRYRWRFFNLLIGQIEELAAETRELTPAERDRLGTAKQMHPAYIAERGGSVRDDADDHITDLTRRFYSHVATRSDALAAERGAARLILMGPDVDVHMFEAALTPRLRSCVVARLPSLSAPQASPDEVLKKVRDTAGRVEQEETAALLDRIREEGLWGLEASLVELQRGRIHTLAAPWPASHLVYRERRSGTVAATAERAAAAATGPQDVQELSLAEVLPELTVTFGVKLVLVRDENRTRLLDELGGLGGLLRW